MSKKKSKSTKKKDENEKEEDSVIEKEDSKDNNELQIGDFVKIDITGRIKKTNDVFITTIREIAEKEEILDENELLYTPHMVIIGDNISIQGLSITGLSEKLVGMKYDETKAFTIPPKDAFGEHSAKNVKDYTMKKIKAVEKNPRHGKRITIDNKSGIITRLDTRGRVKVDFNHPYAGFDILYEVSIKETISDKNEKIQLLIQSKIPLKDPEKIKFDQEDDILSITIPGDIAIQLSRHLPMIKFGLSLDFQRHLGFETIKFIEIFSKNIFGAPPSTHENEHDHE